eukprot:m.109948 g.109948  ORF g.109948 m.109948 type:complete len:877 (-) comp28000_c0_seq1:32-2662(-)
MDVIFAIGDRVTHKTGTGTVRFYGRTEFSHGAWVGVELDAPSGKNDGEVKDVRYFQTKLKHGLFAKPDKLVVLEEPARQVEPPLFEMETFLRSKLADMVTELANAKSKVSELESTKDINGSGNGVSDDTTEQMEMLKMQNGALKDASRLAFEETSKVKALLQELEQAQYATNNNDNKTTELDVKLSKLTTELESQKQLSNTQVDELTTQLSELEIQKQTSDAQVVELQREVESAKAAHGEAVASLERVQQSASETEQGKQQQEQMLADQLKAVKEAARLANDEAQTQKRLVAEKTSEISNIQAVLTATKLELQEKIAANDASQEIVVQLQGALDDKAQIVDTLTLQLENLKLEQEAQREVDRLEKERTAKKNAEAAQVQQEVLLRDETAKTEAQRLESEMVERERKRHLESLNKTIQRLQTELSDINLAHESTREALVVMTERATKSENDMKVQLSLLQTSQYEGNSAQDDNSMLMQQNAALKDASRLAYEQLSSVKDTTLKQIADMEKTVETAKVKVKEMTLEVDAKEKTKEDAVKASEASRKLVMDIQQKLDVSEESVQTFMAQCMLFKTQNKTRSDELAAALLRIQKLEKAYKQSENNLQTFKSALEIKIKEVNKNHTNQVNQIKRDLERSRREATESKLSFEALVQQQQVDDAAKEKAFAAETVELKQKLEDATADKERSALELEGAVDHISYLKSRVEVLQETLADAKQQLDPLVKRGLVRALHEVPINAAQIDFSNIVNVSIPEVVLMQENGSDFHAYKIVINAGTESWTIFRRYSQLLELNTEIEKTMNKGELVPFPKKTTFGKRNDTVVQERRKILEQYLRRVINLVTRDETCPLHSAPTKSTLLEVFPFFSEETITMGEIDFQWEHV